MPPRLARSRSARPTKMKSWYRVGLTRPHGRIMPLDEQLPIHLHTPLTDEALRDLSVGDQVLLSGMVYTARDAAHKRLFEALAKDESLPISLEGQIIYYVGPAPARPGEVIGSAG